MEGKTENKNRFRRTKEDQGGKSKISIFPPDNGGTRERGLQTNMDGDNRRKKCSKKADEEEGERRG